MMLMAMENIATLFRDTTIKVNGAETYHLERERKSFPTVHITRDNFQMESKTELAATFLIQAFMKVSSKMAISMGKELLLMLTIVRLLEIG